MESSQEETLIEESGAAAQPPPAAPAVSWEAPEFEFHHKGVGWYLAFALVLAALVAIAIVTRQWLTVALFGAMGAALGVYASRHPRHLHYSLDETGVSIEGKHHDYDEFRSFAVIQDGDWYGVDLDPTKRFAPRVSLPLTGELTQTVVEVLGEHLPMTERQADLVDKITRRLKF